MTTVDVLVDPSLFVDEDDVAKKPRPRKPVRTSVSLHVYIVPAIRDALDRYVEADSRSITSAVELALKKFLTEKGFWPPPPAS